MIEFKCNETGDIVSYRDGEPCNDISFGEFVSNKDKYEKAKEKSERIKNKLMPECFRTKKSNS